MKWAFACFVPYIRRILIGLFAHLPILSRQVGICWRIAQMSWWEPKGEVVYFQVFGYWWSSLDEVQMSPTRRWELHRWIRILKDDW